MPFAAVAQEFEWALHAQPFFVALHGDLHSFVWSVAPTQASPPLDAGVLTLRERLWVLVAHKQSPQAAQLSQTQSTFFTGGMLQ